MRYRVGCVPGVCLFACFFATACFAQGSLDVNEAAIRMEFFADRTAIELPVRNESRTTIAARVRAELVDPQGTVRGGASQDSFFPPGLTTLKFSIATAPSQNSAPDLKELLWYRLKYSVAVTGPAAGGSEQVRGILSASEAARKLFDLHVVGPPLVKVGSPSALRVRAVHPVTLQPIEGVAVQGSIDLDNDTETPLFTSEAKTDRQGFATLRFTLPKDIDRDEYGLDVTVTGKLGDISEKAEGDLQLNHFSSILISTDKPMYQPGQMLHTRLMAFDADHKAVANQSLSIEIRDPENSIVFRAAPATSRFGVASFDWQIPESLRLGHYSLEAAIGDSGPANEIGRASIRISRYDLPEFTVTAKPDRAYYLPDQNAEVEVNADYLFGQPVTRGHVRVVQESERNWNYREQRWDVKEGVSSEGETDERGRYTAHIDLSRKQSELAGNDYERFRDISLAAYFTDASTGRTEQRRFDLRLTKEPIHVYFIGSNQWSPKDLPLEFFVSTDYADGTPAQCEVEIGWTEDEPAGNSSSSSIRQFLRRIRTNRYGVAKIAGLSVPTQASTGQGYLTFRAKDRQGAIGTHAESNWGSHIPGLRVETNKTLYALNEPIDIEIFSSVPNTTVVVEAQHEFQTIASRVVRVRNGHASITFPPNKAFQNRVSIVAFGMGRVPDNDRENLLGNRSVYFPKQNDLSIEVHPSKATYRPSEEASATVRVSSADGNETVSDLGLVVIDKAVEERARTDRDFSGPSGFFQFNEGWRGSDELNGIRLRDLDKLDLSKPIPDGLEVVADALVQMYPAYPNHFGSKLAEDNLKTIFAGEINPVLEPLRAVLDRAYAEKRAYPKTDAELAAELNPSGIRLDGILDPWGNPYRARFGVKREMDTLEFVSAGPDKRFDTEDDFVALELKHPYFAPYAQAIRKAVDEFHARAGGYIRDLPTLKAELARAGIDLDALKDPWGRAYSYEFRIRQTQFTIDVISSGPPKASRYLDVDFSLASINIDYFSGTLAQMDAALNKCFQDHQVFPQALDELISCLQGSKVSLKDLRDPWGHPYYATFREGAMYADRIEYETYDDHVARAAQHLELMPVTRIMRYVDIRSAGPDGIEGTPDDFLAATFSRAIFEQSAQDRKAKALPGAQVLSGATGAISGTVTDQSGGVIQGAQLTAVNDSTGQSFEAKADDGGAYTLANLPAGDYLVRASSRGFRQSTITSVPVRSSTVTKLDVVLSPGELNQSVTVTEAVPEVETATASFALNGREAAGATTHPRPVMTPRLREYFPETLYWQPELITDKSGHARINFPLADNITTWKLSAVASTEDGRVGMVEKEIRAFQPFFVEHDPPKFLTAGDEIDYPVVLRNYMDRSLQLTAEMKPEGWYTPLGPVSMKAKVAARDNTRKIFKFRATAAVKDGKQRITAAGADAADAIERTLTVRPDGEERTDTASQVFGADGEVDIRVPGEAIPGSLVETLKIYPNLNAHVLESIEAILERPYGCGEQTISSAYPSLLLLQLAKNRNGAAPPALVARAKHYVELGYNRLLTYHAPGGGITYWGRGVPDVALTAYGLKFLSEAREFVDVDDTYVTADLKWLLQDSQSDGRWIAKDWEGKENARRTAIFTAYVARVIAGIKVDSPDAAENAQLSRDIAAVMGRAFPYLESQVNANDEPYLIASYALAARAAGEQARAQAALVRLRALEHREADTSYWSLETNTPFYGWGLAGRIETTALAVQALQDAAAPNGADAALISRGLLFLLRNQDRFGIWYSTQATVNVLSALSSLTSPAGSGQGSLGKSSSAASILVDGRQYLVLDLPGPDEIATPVLADLSKYVTAGDHRVEIRRGAGVARASMQLLTDYYVPWTHSGNAEALQQQEKSSEALQLRVQYDKQSVKTGQEVRCDVDAERVGFRGYGMLLAEIGLPPGAEVDRNSLEIAAAASGWEINHYDVLPDRVVLYLWPQAGGTKLHFTFKPRFGMKALTVPSTLYDYYNPEAHATVEPVRFQVEE